MLIYNHKKEFLGIDEADLKALGFTNLQQLREESADFADLFVKTPGFIHNFKHVHWIDFITCAEGNEDAKVVIHTKGKNYKSTLEIETLYLIDNPAQKAYSIKLMHLRELTHKENEQIAGDLLERPVLKKATVETPQKIEPIIEEIREITPAEVVLDPYEIDETQEDVYETSRTFEEPDSVDLFEEDETQESTEIESTSEEDDFKIDLDDVHEEEITPPVVEVTKPTKTATAVVEDTFDSTYVYDPKVASDELGLPVDLIEEFIQDFINQAQEFKEPLYDSLNKGDIDNVKVLSHKLKGVAANLRIEDAFEVLVTINTSNNQDEIETNLRHFYIIISKLAGEEIEYASPSQISDDFGSDEEDLDLNFKEETPTSEEETALTPEETVEEPTPIDLFDEEDLYMDHPSEEKIADEDVPEKIEIAELADDDFVIQSAEEENLEDDVQEDVDAFMHETVAEESAEEEYDLFTLDEPEEKPLENLVEENFTTDDATAEIQKPVAMKIEYKKDIAANEIGLSQESFDELFIDFVADSKEIFSEIDEAIAMNESSLWQKNAKKLKAMSDNMRIHDFAVSLEKLMTTQDANIAKDSLSNITHQLDAISSLED
jgi:HPt (histidine-containing phosphotransfer) domain-containing protein